MFCSRLNDDQDRVTQYLGSATVDLSTVTGIVYSLVIKDSSSTPPLRMGRVSIKFDIPVSKLKHLRIQNEQFARDMYSAADSNLSWIQGFGPKGLPAIVEGLKYVHSPYYVNHMGVTLPSGAFCMIPTVLDDDFSTALRSHQQRLMVALSRNCMTTNQWMEGIIDMFESSIKSRHLRCLSVVADAVTLHARLDIKYTPDVQLTPTPKGTERWEVPREPTENGGLSFTGDCEDFAREVYQQCKELKSWIKPSKDSMMGVLSAVLHMYVPTIEQGAVDSSAHSKYITYEAAYRNHIWAALHPRNAWRFKMKGDCSLKQSYSLWSEMKCERTLPLLHLEGTGEVYPVVTGRKPGYIAKIKQMSASVRRENPCVIGTSTPDMSLQCEHRSNFYKYPIAFMTDAFEDQGLLDYTYVTNGKYGVDIYDWARGKYKFRASSRHSPETMENIRRMIRLERPILPITTESKILSGSKQLGGYYLRFGKKTPIDSPGTVEYKVGPNNWYEVYFKVGEFDGNSSELDLKE
tara:strand:+ start:31 stop:1587 length:1557 start_codon:yes stop_codon:yes gene_type:complete